MGNRHRCFPFLFPFSLPVSTSKSPQAAVIKPARRSLSLPFFFLGLSRLPSFSSRSTISALFCFARLREEIHCAHACCDGRQEAAGEDGVGEAEDEEAGVLVVGGVRDPEGEEGGVGSEMWMDHWRQMKAKEAEEAARPLKKRKRVLKQRLPKAVIDLMVARPFRSVEDLTPAQLAKRSTKFRQFYPLTTFVDAKLRDYEQALVRQYNAQGYAEEEIEVTDSEAEEDDATVVDN